MTWVVKVVVIEGAVVVATRQSEQRVQQVCERHGGVCVFVFVMMEAFLGPRAKTEWIN